MKKKDIFIAIHRFHSWLPSLVSWALHMHISWLANCKPCIFAVEKSCPPADVQCPGNPNGGLP
jgi:hypothetical protein